MPLLIKGSSFEEFIKLATYDQFKEELSLQPKSFEEHKGEVLFHLFNQEKIDEENGFSYRGTTKSKVHFFRHLIKKGITKETHVGDSNESVLIYLVKDRNAGEGYRFIKTLLESKNFSVNFASEHNEAVRLAIYLDDLILLQMFVKSSNIDSQNLEKDLLIYAIKQEKPSYAKELLDKLGIHHIENFLKCLFENAKILNPGENGVAKRQYDKEWENLMKVALPKVTEHQENWLKCLELVDFITSQEDTLLLETILEFSGFNVNQRLGINGKTLAMKAVEKNNIPLLKILAAKKADFNMEDKFNFTVAHFVISAQAAEIVLTEENIDLNYNRGDCPFHLAIKNRRSLGLIECFIKKGVNLYSTAKNILHVLSECHVDLDSEKGVKDFTDFTQEIFKQLLKYNKDIPKLLEQVSGGDTIHLTPLNKSVLTGNVILFKILLEKENYYQITSLIDGETLVTAACRGITPIVSHILDQKPDSRNFVPTIKLLSIAKLVKASIYLDNNPKNEQIKMLNDEYERRFGEFKEKLENNPDLLTTNAGQLAVELFDQGLTDFFVYSISKGLDLTAPIGRPGQNMLIYFSKNKPKVEKNRRFLCLIESQRFIDEKHEFIDVLLKSEKFNSHFKPLIEKVLKIAIGVDEVLYRKLIDHNYIDLKITNNYKETPLIYAIKLKKVVYAKELLEKNAVIGDAFELLSCLNKRTQFVHEKEHDSRGRDCQRKNWEELVEKILPLLKLRSTDANEEGPDFAGFVSFISKFSSFLGLKTIFEFCDFDVNAQTSHDRTTIAIEAAKNNNLNLLKILKDNKNVNFDKEDIRHSTAAHYLDSVEAAESVLTKKNINHINSSQNSPLFEIVSKKGNLQLIDHLILKGAVFSNDSKNILHVLSDCALNMSSTFDQKEFNQFVQGLFQKIAASGQDVEKLLRFQSDGKSPLEKSFETGNHVLFKILLKKQNLYNVKNLDDGEILRTALNKGQTEIVKIILSQKTGSANSAPLEILKIILEETKKNSAHPKKEEFLQLLNDTISKFSSPLEVNDQPKITDKGNLDDLVASSMPQESTDSKTNSRNSLDTVQAEISPMEKPKSGVEQDNSIADSGYDQEFENFKQRLNNYSSLPRKHLENLVLELFNDGKVELFAYMMERELNTEIRVGKLDKPMLVYLAENFKMEKRNEFIDILLNNKDFETNRVVNTQFDEGRALHIAIRIGDDDLFKKLINYTDIDLVDSYINGETPLVCAIKEERLEYVYALLEKNIQIVDVSHILTALFDHAKVLTPKKDNVTERQYSEEWQKLIEKILPLLDLQDYGKKSFNLLNFLSFISQKKDIFLLKTIFKFCKFDINASIGGTDGDTIAIRATQRNNIELLKILKAENANFDKVVSKSTAAHYLLSVAAAEIVLTPKNTDYADEARYPPLLEAISDKRGIDLINYLIEKSKVFECSFNNILHLLPNISDILSSRSFPRNRKPHKKLLTDFVENLFKRMSDLSIDIEPLLKQLWKGVTPLEISCSNNDFVLFKILLKKEKESAKEIQSLRDGKILLEALIWDANKVINHILSQGAESGNYVSLEGLKYAAKELKAQKPLSDITARLKLLNDAIRKFPPSEQLHEIPQSLANNISPAATQTKIGTDIPIIVATPSSDPLVTGKSQTPVDVDQIKAAQQLTPNQLQSSNSLLQPAEKQKLDNVSTNTPQDNSKQNVDPKVLENNAQPPIVPKPSSSEPKNHSNQSDIRVAHDNELKQSQDEKKNKHSDADSNSSKTNKSDIFIVRWLKTFAAWAGEMIDRICNFFTGNTPKNGGDKGTYVENDTKIGSAPPTPLKKNQGEEQNIS